MDVAVADCKPGAYKCSDSFRAVAASAHTAPIAVVRRYTSGEVPVYALGGFTAIAEIHPGRALAGDTDKNNWTSFI